MKNVPFLFFNVLCFALMITVTAGTQSAEMNYNVGKFKIFFLLNHFFLSLNIVNILQMNIDDEKSQMDLLKVQKHRK